MTYYWFRTCPRCDQGRLLIARKTATNEFFEYCEECMSGWLAESTDSYVAFVDDKFEYNFPSLDEIKAAGWDKFDLREFHEDNS